MYKMHLKSYLREIYSLKCMLKLKVNELNIHLKKLQKGRKNTLKEHKRKKKGEEQKIMKI